MTLNGAAAAAAAEDPENEHEEPSQLHANVSQNKRKYSEISQNGGKSVPNHK